MRKKTLSAGQNEQVRRLMKHLLEVKTQTELAEGLHLTQSCLSMFLRGHMGTSRQVAERLGVLLGGWTVEEVLAGRAAGSPDPFTNRGRAMEIAATVGAPEVLPAAIEIIGSIPPGGDDLPVRTWLAMIWRWDEHLRLGLPAPLGWQPRRHS